jgi:hypothetical protein
MPRALFGGLLVGSLALASPTLGQARSLPFSDGGWKLDGPSLSVANVEGRDSLAVETGFAERSDARFADGTIEFDVQLTRRRSFVYVSFRIHDDDTREEFYLRPHKSTLPDAVQYAPVYQGQSAWQLHHGPGGTTAMGFEPGAWTHVKVVVEGTRAALFVGGGTAPVLIVPRLCGKPGAGAISVGGFAPPGTPGSGPIARFANVTLRPEVDPVDWGTGPKPFDPGPGTIRSWSVSNAVTPLASQVPQPPAGDGWRTVAVEPEGLLALDRHVTRPKGARLATAAARVQVTAPEAATRVFELGFSDIATVFLNGRPVFTGDATYSFDAPRRDGLIGFDQARLYLPLVKGRNELVVVVSDVFGGWGLMGRFPDAAGLGIEAR